MGRIYNAFSTFKVTKKYNQYRNEFGNILVLIVVSSLGARDRAVLAVACGAAACTQQLCAHAVVPIDPANRD